MRNCDYYLGGSLMSERSWSATEYRYGGAGGQEMDNEISGKGNSYTAEYWQYDSRLLRRWNVDPAEKKYPEYSPYSAFFNNPILFNDPFGDDPDPKKASRSTNKYGRKFDRMNRRMNRGSLSASLDQVHQRMEQKHNNKRWMWIKDASDGDAYATTGGHKNYWHAGDLFRQANPRSNPVVTTTQTRTTTSNLTLNSSGSVINPDNFTNTLWEEYSISGSGTVNVGINVDAPGWNFDFIQGDGSSSPIVVHSNLYDPSQGVNTVDNWQSTATDLSATRSIPLDVTQGNLFYVAINFRGVTASSSTGGAAPTTSVSMTTTTTVTRSRPAQFQAKAVPVIYNATSGTRNVHRLTPATRDALNRRREDFKLRNR